MAEYSSKLFKKLGDPIRMNDRLFDFFKMILTKESDHWSNVTSREGFSKSYIWLLARSLLVEFLEEDLHIKKFKDWVDEYWENKDFPSFNDLD